MCGHPAPRREAGQRAAPCLAARTQGGGGLGADAELDGALIAAYGGNNTAGPIDVATACNAHGGPHGRLDFESETFVAHSPRGEGFDASEDGTGRGTPLVPVAVDHYNGALTGDVAATLSTGGATTTGSGPSVMVPVAHAFDARQSDVIQYGDRTGPLDTDGHSVAVATGFYPTAGQDFPCLTECSPSVKVGSGGSSGNPPGVQHAMQVRRLTPVECERLQGFPDGYTAIPWRGKPASECPDGPRYKALGNSMAVPVMRWIGERIAAVDQAG
jgi:DNA (cytosine-5)-methyltransferase 1